MNEDKICKLNAEKRQNENEIRQLQNRQKILLNRNADAERKERTRRLIVHGAILERIYPPTATMSDEELTAVLERIFRGCGSL